jgi:hypothetical protein
MVLRQTPFHDVNLGDKVDNGIGLSYRPTSLCSLTGQCDNPMPWSTLSPQSGTMNWASDQNFTYTCKISLKSKELRFVSYVCAMTKEDTSENDSTYILHTYIKCKLPSENSLCLSSILT